MRGAILPLPNTLSWRGASLSTGTILHFYIEKIGCEDVDWIKPAQNGDQWRALVNMVLKFGFNGRGRIYLKLLSRG
jgi:hypothetical protein